MNNALKYFYGVEKTYHTNTKAFEKNVEKHIDSGLISRRQKDGDECYRSSIDPIYSEIEKRMNSSRESYKEDEFKAMKLVVDSDWFRNFFSYQMIIAARDFECIREYVSLDPREMNVNRNFKGKSPLKIHIDDPVNIGRCLMNTTGIVCFYLQGFLVKENYCTNISVEDIVSAGSFDTVISKSFEKNSPVNAILENYLKYCKKYCVADTGPFTPPIPIIPEVLLRSMVEMAPFLPSKICNIFMKMEVRNQLTLLNIYYPAAVKVTDEFEKAHSQR